MAKTKSAAETAGEIIKGGFSLDKFKKNKGFSNSSVKFKEQAWIGVSKAFEDITSLPGIPTGHITLLRGHSDTGKTTTGEIIDYRGFFLYADRGTLNTIEDVAAYILDLLDEQKKGNLPYDLCFFWDSVGSVPCELSVRSNKNNNEWNAGAMSTQFGNNLNQKILLSRKEGSKHTNTLVAINKVWTMKPEHPMGQPKLQNKGGMAMWYDATLIITFGNITNPGTSKIKATAKGKEYEFAKKTKVQIEKNHINGIQSRGSIVMTQHGFIEDEKKAIDNYKDQYKGTWANILGSTDFEVSIEAEVGEDIRDIGLNDE